MFDIIYWIIVGCLAGWMAAWFRNRRDFSTLGSIVLGVIGAAVGGFIFRLVGLADTGFLGSLLMATFGAVIVLALADRMNRR